MQTPDVVHLKLLQKSRELIVSFADGKEFSLPCEYLRVFSPSAEVKGHGNEPRKWVFDKEAVNITSIEPVGHYAVKLVFDDGHQTGIYSWQVLYELGNNFESNWAKYQGQKVQHCHPERSEGSP